MSPDEEQKTYPVNAQINLSAYIFTSSSALVGVCLMVISFIQHAMSDAHGERTLAGDLLTLDAFLFMISCVLSYLAMRRRSFTPHPVLERGADSLFVVALILMTVICGMVTYLMV